MVAVLRGSLVVTVLVSMAVSEAFGQAVITSSASSGFICNGGFVSFNCRATGSGLVWSYNGSSLDYPSLSGDNILPFPGRTNTYASLLSSSNRVHISELVFLNVSDASSLLINCFEEGMPTSAVVTVIREGVAPENIDIPDNYTMDNNSIIISWSHPLQHLVNHYQIMVDGSPHAPVIHGSVTQTQILLGDCESHSIHVVAVDVCNNARPSIKGSISCVPSPMTTATTSNSESSTTSTESMTASERRARNTLNAGIALIVLGLVLIAVYVFGVIASILWHKKKVCRQDNEDTKSNTVVGFSQVARTMSKSPPNVTES